MHIKSVDKPGEQKETSSSARKFRLGGSAARVPAQKESTESPLRAFVSALGQSIGSRTPLRKQGSTSTSVKNGVPSSSTISSGRPTNTSQTPSKQSLQSRLSNPSTTTPRKSFLSSSSALKKPSTSVTPSQIPAPKQSSSSSLSGPSTRSTNIPKTPVGKRGTTMPPRTPTSGSGAQNNPTTPLSKYSSIPTPGKRQSLPLTPISKQAVDPKTPSTQRKQGNPKTPVSKQISVPPSTPVSYSSSARTPASTIGSRIPAYTPKSAFASKSSLPSPLQPRNTNIPSESSRRLHFGINLSAMAEQENMGLSTPRPNSSYTVDPTLSVDRNRIAHIKARRNAFQKLLTSPAQRVRVDDSTQSALTPLRVQVGDENSRPLGAHGAADFAGNHSPSKRRVANSLF